MGRRFLKAPAHLNLGNLCYTFSMAEDFPGQNTGEKTIKTFRKNPLTLTKRILKFLIFLVVSIFFLTYISQLEILSFAASYINIAALAGVVFSFSYGFYVWMTWYYDVYILTSERIIEARQKGFFSREVKEIDLHKIQDITYNVSGFIATIIGLGNVHIKSVSGLEIEMERVGKPSVVREVILKLAEKKAKKELSADDIAKALAERLTS